MSAGSSTLRGEYAGKSVLITGAGKGLGKAYAHWFADRGASVVVNNRAHPNVASSAQSVVDAIAAKAGRANRG